MENDDYKDGAVIAGMFVFGSVVLTGAAVCGIVKAICSGGGEAEKPAEVEAEFSYEDRKRIREEEKAEEWEKAGERCREAEERGEDVCWECRTVSPRYCQCGKCIDCNGGGISECNSCCIDRTTSD